MKAYGWPELQLADAVDIGILFTSWAGKQIPVQGADFRKELVNI